MRVNHDDRIDQMIVRLSNFSRALALPVRIYIIRQILTNQNYATRKQLHELPFKVDLINTHLQELKHLGIITTVHEDGNYYHSVDINKFVSLSNSYLDVFEPISKLGNETTELASRPKLKKQKPVHEPEHTKEMAFGAYIRSKRREAGLNQTELCRKMIIGRRQLGKVESGLAMLQPDKLKILALVLSIPLAELIDQYHGCIMEIISQTII